MKNKINEILGVMFAILGILCLCITGGIGMLLLTLLTPYPYLLVAIWMIVKYT